MKKPLIVNIIDVVKAHSISDIVKYLGEADKKYKNIFFSGHGVYDQSAQVIGEVQYNQEKIQKEKTSANLAIIGSKHILDDGNVVLLGCFTSNKKFNGELYVGTLAKIMRKNVYGSQGESYLSRTFTNEAIGGVPLSETEVMTYFKEATENAGKWSIAKPNGELNSQIGNIRVDEKGNISTTKEIFNPNIKKQIKEKKSNNVKPKPE